MVYDDSRYRGEPGFRDEPDFRSSGVPEDAPSVSSIYSPGSYPVDDYGPASESTLTMASSRRSTPSAAELDGVFADRSDKGLLVTAGFTLLIALGAGAVIAVLVAGFHVPSWAASFGAALALLVWIDQHRAEKVVAGAYDPHKHALYWFAGLAVLS